MEELSYYLGTVEKVQELKELARIEQEQQRRLKEQQSKKLHFQIDWRNLTYVRKSSPLEDISSFLFRKKGNLIRNFSSTNCNEDNNDQKFILNSLDGCFRSGQISAILGPSGAGKSTFLSTLFGAKQDNAFGETKVTWLDNNNSIVNEDKTLKKRSLRTCFLPQHDHLLHHLTVFETLMFASKLKNSKRTINYHRQNVKRVAKMLKFSECLDTRCGNLSGGQYKRVSIGQELLSEPDVIILDEPTSGLDSMTCLTTIQTLKSIVKRHPISVILTIHQPDNDVFDLFDRVYVIAQGGVAIYEGPPENIENHLAKVNIKMPINYNPARFIVEQAFLNCEAKSADTDCLSSNVDEHEQVTNINEIINTNNRSDKESSSDDDDDDIDDGNNIKLDKRNYIKRSLMSLTDVISGKEMLSTSTNGSDYRRDKKPLLNIGVQTLDGKLITSEKLFESRINLEVSKRKSLIKKLNQLQKEPYAGINEQQTLSNKVIICGDHDDNYRSLANTSATIHINNNHKSQEKSMTNYNKGSMLNMSNVPSATFEFKCEKSSTKSDYSSVATGWSGADKRVDNRSNLGKANSFMDLSQNHNHQQQKQLTGVDLRPNADSLALSMPMVNQGTGYFMSRPPSSNRESILMSASEPEEEGGNRSPDFTRANGGLASPACSSVETKSLHGCEKQIKDGIEIGRVFRRQFDKRLSPNHSSSQQKDLPIWSHTLLLTHRTWLSIIRDPIFFGIQAAIHTAIPLLLAVIYGNIQEEGCPKIGSFDIVDFAYADGESLINSTMRAIRQSISNVGVVFFQMFVLCFAINCITALIFPIDMHVLLKEYRNGWYSLRSYFMGRTLADLPIPVVLHSIAMTIIYFLTNQPHSFWRFGLLIVLVIMGSLVAQSIGLTVGAILMKSSQSAVLTAAGLTAPVFAFSGFIVRVETLNYLFKMCAQGSYLYHLLNGFIILRHGFGRCPCKEEDFDNSNVHQIPSNLHTMASMWIGTYSDEYSDSNVMMNNKVNRTNVDPNIDVVDKMMNAFKMASSFGRQINNCDDVIPYAMLDFNLRDNDIYQCFIALAIMILISRFITFTAIYYKIRSYS